MTQSINEALVTQFSDMVHTRAQQMGSRFRGKVEEKIVNGNDASIERIDDVQAIEVTTRHAQTVAQDITHDRRQIKMRDFRVTLLLDEFDDLQVLINPQARYVEAVARALMIRFDQVVSEAFFADVNVGRNFDSTLTFANDDGLTVLVAASGLTYDKLLTVQQNFIDNNVGVDLPEQVYITATGEQNTDMLQEQELTSGDYTREFAVEKGRIVNAAGLDVVYFSGTDKNQIISKTGNTRDLVAWAKGGVEVGINKDISIKVNERPDLNNLTQIQATMYIGATRKDGKMVQKVQADES